MNSGDKMIHGNTREFFSIQAFIISKWQTFTAFEYTQPDNRLETACPGLLMWFIPDDSEYKKTIKFWLESELKQFVRKSVNISNEDGTTNRLSGCYVSVMEFTQIYEYELLEYREAGVQRLFNFVRDRINKEGGSDE